jgi:hypothetical protein
MASQITIEVFDNEDGSFYSLCPICGASSLAWDGRESAHEMMTHMQEEHYDGEEYI